jgi:hypothetical protein
MAFKVFGRNGDRMHKMLEAFFSCQDPLKATPSKKALPNFKITSTLPIRNL